MSLKFMYITNNPQVAIIAQKCGVDRIWIDLETTGKCERQKHIDSVKSHHCIENIKQIAPLLDVAEMMVRVNPISNDSKNEIDQVIEAGADIIMLPMWRVTAEVSAFLKCVGGRVKTTLLLETSEAVDCIDEVLAMGGFDEIHIGLNDLHLSYGLNFMFELLSNGVVEGLCEKFKQSGIPYGFGGIAGIGEGTLPAEKIVMEHYNLGSSRVILSRSFCNTGEIISFDETEKLFVKNMTALREFEKEMSNLTLEAFQNNKLEIKLCVDRIVAQMKARGKNEL